MATVDVTYRPSRTGIPALAASPQMLGVVEDRARALRTVAEGLAPVESGRYRRSFRTYSFVAPFGGFPRATATVVNEAPHAAAVEFGNARARGQHVLGRALVAFAGGR